MSRPLASIAYHEAGHAVAMIGLGFPVGLVSIVPEADSLGRVVPAGPPPATGSGPPLTTTQLALVHVGAVITFVAGAEAERLAGYDPAGCDSDEADAYAMEDWVWDLLGVPPWRWRHVARAAAASYLSENWPAVERVAAALLAHADLPGERARELVGTLSTPDLKAVAGALSYWANHETRARERAFAQR